MTMPVADDEALESLPMRLMVVAIAAAMSIVPAAEALETLQDRDFVSRARLTMDRIIGAAQVLSMQGPGAARTVDVDLSSQGGLRAVSLSVGDGPGGAYANALVLGLSSGASLVALAQEPSVAMSSETGATLVVSTDRFCLRMEARLVGDERIVSVEVV